MPGGGLEIGERISEKQAINRLRSEKGLDVFSDCKELARSLAKRALKGKPMFHDANKAGYFPHFHPNMHENGSHSFFE